MPRQADVGVDVFAFRPVTLAEIGAHLRRRGRGACGRDAVRRQMSGDGGDGAVCAGERSRGGMEGWVGGDYGGMGRGGKGEGVVMYWGEEMGMWNEEEMGGRWGCKGVTWVVCGMGKGMT